MFDMGKYWDIVRCAKSDNLTESDREIEKRISRICLAEHEAEKGSIKTKSILN